MIGFLTIFNYRFDNQNIPLTILDKMIKVLSRWMEWGVFGNMWVYEYIYINVSEWWVDGWGLKDNSDRE